MFAFYRSLYRSLNVGRDIAATAYAQANQQQGHQQDGREEDTRACLLRTAHQLPGLYQQYIDSTVLPLPEPSIHADNSFLSQPAPRADKTELERTLKLANDYSRQPDRWWRSNRELNQFNDQQWQQLIQCYQPDDINHYGQQLTQINRLRQARAAKREAKKVPANRSNASTNASTNAILTPCYQDLSAAFNQAQGHHNLSVYLQALEHSEVDTLWLKPSHLHPGLINPHSVLSLTAGLETQEQAQAHTQSEFVQQLNTLIDHGRCYQTRILIDIEHCAHAPAILAALEQCLRTSARHWHQLGIILPAYALRALPQIAWLWQLSRRLQCRIPVVLNSGLNNSGLNSSGLNNNSNNSLMQAMPGRLQQEQQHQAQLQYPRVFDTPQQIKQSLQACGKLLHRYRSRLQHAYFDAKCSAQLSSTEFTKTLQTHTEPSSTTLAGNQYQSHQPGLKLDLFNPLQRRIFQQQVAFNRSQHKEHSALSHTPSAKSQKTFKALAASAPEPTPNIAVILLKARIYQQRFSFMQALIDQHHYTPDQAQSLCQWLWQLLDAGLGLLDLSPPEQYPKATQSAAPKPLALSANCAPQQALLMLTCYWLKALTQRDKSRLNPPVHLTLSASSCAINMSCCWLAQQINALCAELNIAEDMITIRYQQRLNAQRVQASSEPDNSEPDNNVFSCPPHWSLVQGYSLSQQTLTAFAHTILDQGLWGGGQHRLAAKTWIIEQSLIGPVISQLQKIIASTQHGQHRKQEPQQAQHNSDASFSNHQPITISRCRCEKYRSVQQGLLNQQGVLRARFIQPGSEQIACIYQFGLDTLNAEYAEEWQQLTELPLIRLISFSPYQKNQLSQILAQQQGKISLSLYGSCPSYQPDTEPTDGLVLNNISRIEYFGKIGRAELTRRLLQQMEQIGKTGEQSAIKDPERNRKAG